MPAPPTPTTGDELRLWLQNRLPGFKEAIRASYKPDDGVYTPHHVCSVLTAFFRDGQVDYASPRVVALFAMIEEVVARDPRGFTPISNAFFTCFLENLSCTPAGEACLPHMGSVSSTFFRRGTCRAAMPRRHSPEGGTSAAEAVAHASANQHWPMRPAGCSG